MNYPPAIQRRSPKHGYGNDDTLRREGIVAHSMEGPLAAAFGELDRPDRQASWHFSVAKDGKVYQHLDTEHISYASGSYNANKRFWSIEHEGYAGEPLTGPQLQATIALMRWLLSLANLAHLRKLTLWEHNEMTAFGADPTACPSNRIPWPVIIAELEEDDMPLTDDDINRIIAGVVATLRSAEFNVPGINARVGKGVSVNDVMTEVQATKTAVGKIATGGATADQVVDRIKERL